MIDDFFYNISMRLRKENNLSDFTWAMCETCYSFRDAFLLFFFDKIDLDADITIEREESTDGSRPDFVIHCGESIYIIENKINDTNQHFGQYDEAFDVDPSQFGYITNYKILNKDVKTKAYQLRTWEQLYDKFMDNLPEDEKEKELWLGYLEYIKSVCNLVKIEKPMRLDGIYSLYCLMEIFEKLSDRDDANFELSIYSSNSFCGSKASRNGFTGVNFEVKYKAPLVKQKCEIWGWIGIYYNSTEPCIAIEFKNTQGWGKDFCDLVLPYKSKWSDGSTFLKPYFEEKEFLTFELSEELHQKFEKSQDVAEQEKILKQFMDEVLLYPNALKQG